MRNFNPQRLPRVFSAVVEKYRFDDKDLDNVVDAEFSTTIRYSTAFVRASILFYENFKLQRSARDSAVRCMNIALNRYRRDCNVSFPIYNVLDFKGKCAILLLTASFDISPINYAQFSCHSRCFCMNFIRQCAPSFEVISFVSFERNIVCFIKTDWRCQICCLICI